MYKRLGLILISFLLLTLLVGCINIGCHPKTNEQILQISLDEFSTFDLNNDGEADKLVYEFAEEEIAEDIYLNRRIDFEKTTLGTEGTISLKFNDRSNNNTDYIHVETIPKEFAININELEFSVPPDEIVNPDIEVRWDKKTIDVAAHYLIEITKNFGKWDPDMVVEMCAETVIQYNKVKFAKIKSGAERDKAILQAASKLTNMTLGKPSYDLRIEVCSMCTQPYAAAACVAILTGDPKECDTCGKLSKADIDLCRGIYVQDKCDGIADKQAREKCYFENAIDIECKIACNAITDKDNRNLCLAAVNDDVTYCEKIQDQQTYEKCLQAFDEALEEEDAIKEIEAYCKSHPEEPAGGQVYGKCFKCVNQKPVIFDCSEWDKYFPPR